MGPITVCYCTVRLDAGGAEHQLIALLECLDRKRFRPLVVVEELGGPLDSEVRALGVPIHVIARRMRWDAVLPFRLARLLRRERVQVIHPVDPMYNIYGPIAGWLARVRVRLTTLRSLRFPLFHGVLLWLIMPLVSRLVANSNHAAERLRRLFKPRRRVMAIPNGLDVERFAGAPELGGKRRALGLEPDDGPIVGMVAGLREPKDHETVLDAARRLLDRFPKLVLLFVGEGPRRDELEARAAQLLPPGRCRFLGVRSDTAELYHLFDVSVLATGYEGMPNVVMETMAAGRPIVATAVAGCAELIEDGVRGLLMPPRDPAALADAIARLVQDRTLGERLGQAGREHMRAHYSLERMVERYEVLYEQLLAKGRAQPEGGRR